MLPTNLTAVPLPVPTVGSHGNRMTTVRAATTVSSSVATEVGTATSRSRGRDATGFVLASPATISPTASDKTRRAVCAERHRRRQFARWEI